MHQVLSTATFDLLDQPWIPVVDRAGKPGEVSLREIILRAHELRRIAGETPPMTAALYRLVLALIHRAYEPRDDEAWGQLWKGDTLPSKKLQMYLGKHAAKFDLFHPRQPFLQCPQLAALPPATAAKLVSGRASGNNVTLFDHTTATDRVVLTPAEAARWLVTLLAWDPGGMKTPYRKDKSSERAPCNHFGVVLVEGATLKETLLLNTFVYSQQWEQPPMTTVDDRPVWELPDPIGPEPSARAPEGWTDLLTWPARRVWLSTAQVDGGWLVDGVVITPGTRLRAELEHVELMAAFRRPSAKAKSKTVLPLLPVRLYQNRGIWRHSVELLTPGTGDRRRPRALDHLAGLVELGLISEDTVYTLRVFGQQLDSKSSVVESWTEQHVPAPVALLRADAPRIGGILGCAVQLADDAGSALRAMVRDHRTELRAEPSSTLDLAYWPRLPRPFDAFLRALARDFRAGRPENETTEVWAEAVRQAARAAADQWAYGSPRQGRSLLAAGKVHAAFTGRLYQLLEKFPADVAAYSLREDAA